MNNPWEADELFAPCIDYDARTEEMFQEGWPEDPAKEEDEVEREAAIRRYNEQGGY